jgi:hypothetical protein
MKKYCVKFLFLFLISVSAASAQDTTGVEVRSRMIEIISGGGYLRNDYSALNHYLQSRGYRGVSENMSMYSFGIAPNVKRFIMSYELLLYSSPKQSNPGNLQMNMSGWGSQLTFGYQVVKKEKFRFYPYAGIISSYTGLKIQEDNNAITTMDNVLSTQKNNATITFTNFALNLGVKADFMFIRPSDTECPQISRYMSLGVRTGYYLPFTYASKAEYNGNTTIHNAPNVGMKGFYVQMVVGFGRKIKEMNWK